MPVPAHARDIAKVRYAWPPAIQHCGHIGVDVRGKDQADILHLGQS
jgi:hypothetical protein